MTSKEMEARSGVPRANIRYYEAEGLLSPVRRGNGYRDYSEEDLRTLEKIKLLRRLGVSVEELRALGAGEADLAAVLDRRLAELGGERASLDRVQRVCGDLRRTGGHLRRPGPGEVSGGPGRPSPAGRVGHRAVEERPGPGTAPERPAPHGVQRLPAVLRPDV